MKSNIVLVKAFLVLSLGAIAQDLSFATFNCEFLVETKVHMKYGLSYYIKDEPNDVQNQWTAQYRKERFNESCELVAQHIKTINADVIGLTEVGRRLDVELLDKKLKEAKAGYKYYYLSNSSDPTGQHVAVFSKYPLTLVKDEIEGRATYFKEADMDDEKDTGIGKGIHVKVNANDKTFNVFVLHLKSERGGYESDQQRVAQAEVARRAILPLINDPKEYVVVMGDLNSEKRHDVLLRLRGFDDIYPELLQTGNDDYFENEEIKSTYQYRGNQEQIDHILLSPNFNELCYRNSPKSGRWGIKTSIIETKNERISDHNALKVELTFR